jgi:hypothetical protein
MHEELFMRLHGTLPKELIFTRELLITRLEGDRIGPAGMRCRASLEKAASPGESSNCRKRTIQPGSVCNRS